MTQNQAYALVQDAIAAYGAVKGCEIIANALGISWPTVYAWNRRGTVPTWRLDALERIQHEVFYKAAE